MAGLQASYDDSLARLRAAQEAETAALRSQISAAEESNRKACADASYALSQLSSLQVPAPLSERASQGTHLMPGWHTDALFRCEISWKDCTLCCLERALRPPAFRGVLRL